MLISPSYKQLMARQNLVKFCIYDRSYAFREAVETLRASSSLIAEHWTVITPEMDKKGSSASQSDLSSTVQSQHIDAIVSPGNSFGFMDGGFDRAISDYYVPLLHLPGDSVTPLVQKSLARQVNGFNPPGSAVIVDLTREKGQNEEQVSEHNECAVAPLLIHCSTMSMPSEIPKNYPLLFYCTWSLLVAIQNWNLSSENAQITSILLTGLGTGYGKVPPIISANQMATAYKLFAENLKRNTSLTTFSAAKQFDKAILNPLK